MSEKKEITEKILKLIKTSSPDTVIILINKAHRELKIPKEVIMKHIVDLQNDGRLTLVSKRESIPANLKTYIFSSHSTWFWIIILLPTTTTISVFLTIENTYPYVYFRYFLGSIFVFILPGFSLIKALFPTREVDNIERTTLSIGMSLILVPLVGIFLNFTPWGIRLKPIMLSLLSLTIIFSLTDIIQDYKEKHKEITFVRNN